jgi:BirA family biotin operon repressor/biotin-[acetyl-CoA-carboxylase] ligase
VEEWSDRLTTLGQQVKVTGIDGVLEGQAEDVDADGALLVRITDGGLHRIVAGDVTLREEP